MKLYLLDANENIIAMPPTKDLLSLIQDLKLKDTDTIEGALVVSKRYTSIMDNVRYIAVSDRDNDHAFYLYRKTMAEVQDRELIFDGKESFWDDLAGSYIKDKRPGAMLAPDLVKLILDGTRWNVDFVDSGFSETLDTNFYYQSRAEALSSVTSAMTIDIVPMINIEGNTITRRYVNLYLQAGGDNGRRFVYGKNALSVVKKTDDSQVFTALVGRGKSIEQTSTDTETGETTTYNTPKINFADVEWSKAAGDPVDKPKGQEYVEWPESTKLYGYSNGNPRVGIVDFDNDDDPKQLLKDTWAQLQTAGVPSVQFSATVGDVGYLAKGETVTIVNYIKGIAYKTRVTELKWNRLAEAKSQLTIGDKLVKNANERMTAIVASQSSALQAVSERMNKQVANLATIVNESGQNVSYSKDGTMPTDPKENDLAFVRDDDGSVSMKQYVDGKWIILVDDTTGQQIANKVDAKMEQLNADMEAADENLKSAKQDVADLQVKLKDNDDAQAQLKNDLSENSTILEKAQADIVTNTQALSDLDAKLKANDDAQAQLQDDLAANTAVQAQLTTDLSDNVKLVNANKESVDAALVTVNKTLTQAQADAETAVKNADLAVTNAQSAVEASGLATTTANAANDAATAAKELATSTANSFATVQSQASTAASDAATALDQAKSALATANGVNDKYNSIKQIVDDTSGTIKTLATSASVDAVSGRVTKAQSLAEKAADGLTFKADNSVVDAIKGTVKQQGIDLKAAQGELKLKLTQSDLTKGLDGYATQTWAQNQITATATELNSTMTTVQQQVMDSAVGTNLYTDTRNFDNLASWHESGLWTKTTDTYNGLAVMQATHDWNGLSRYIKVKKGDILTYSVYAKYISGTGTSNIYWILKNPTEGSYSTATTSVGSSPVTITDSWQRVSGTAVATSDGYLRPRLERTNGNTNTLQIAGIKVEKGSVATDWCPNPEDNATVTALSSLSQTVDGLTGTFAKKTDLEATESNLKVTADGLNLITDVTGTNGENVTQVIADVKNIKTTMTGANGYTTRLQTLEGFQNTATDNIKGLQTQQTTIAGQYTSLISGLGETNLIYNSEFENDCEGWDKNSYYVTDNSRTNQYKGSKGLVCKITTEKTWGKFRSKPISVSPGEYISASVSYYRGSGSFHSGGMYIYCYANATDTVYLPGYGYAAPNGPQRQLISLENYQVPDGAHYVRLGLEFSGICWLTLNQPMLVRSKTIGPYVRDTAGSSQITQLQNQIDLRTTVDGKVTAALNLSNDGGGTVTIQGASLFVTAASHFDAASIQSAAIASLDAKKITSGSISSDRLATTKLNADNITSGSISADRLATTKLNASNITSGSINAGLITTGVLSADMIVGGTFDASKMTVKNINAGSITSGSIATALLASTKINADNITSGSIAAARIATTALSATNITSGTLDVGKLTVKNLSADLIVSGTIDASKITVKNLSASNIIGGTLDASTMTVKNIDAAAITTGTLNAANLNVVGLNASAITTGTISGANLAINLNTGMVTFQSGRIHSTTNNIDINVDERYISVADSSNRVILKGGQLQFVQPQLFDLQTTPYLSISNDGVGSNWAGATIIGRDSIMLANSANVRSSIYTWEIGKNTFSGLISGKNSDGNWNPTILGGAERGVVIVGGSSTSEISNGSPYIRVGSSLDRKGAGNRIYMRAEYIMTPTIYYHTASGSANVIVKDDGALVRTSSATKYKSNIERFRNTDMGEALLNLPQAHWYNKQDMQRYTDDPQHYSMPELDYGMIAEDLASAGLEDLVVRGDDGQLEDIRYDRMTPALLPLLAKMKQEIEELKGEK